MPPPMVLPRASGWTLTGRRRHRILTTGIPLMRREFLVLQVEVQREEWYVTMDFEPKEGHRLRVTRWRDAGRADLLPVEA